MEKFFEWMVKPVTRDEVDVWFNIHNMHREKTELFGDIFISLHHLILETYLGDETSETSITLSLDEKKQHFQWCWKKLLSDFELENILIKPTGEHKDYIESFFMDTFYFPINESVKFNLNEFLKQTFRMNGTFTKSDLDILTEIYKLMDKSIN